LNSRPKSIASPGFWHRRCSKRRLTETLDIDEAMHLDTPEFSKIETKLEPL
jgi:hypothetical protein